METRSHRHGQHTPEQRTPCQLVVIVMTATGTSATYRAEMNFKTVRHSQQQPPNSAGWAPFPQGLGLILDRVRFRGPSIPRDDELIHRPSRHGLVGHRHQVINRLASQLRPLVRFGESRRDWRVSIVRGAHHGNVAGFLQSLSSISISCVEKGSDFLGDDHGMIDSPEHCTILAATLSDE